MSVNSFFQPVPSSTEIDSLLRTLRDNQSDVATFSTLLAKAISYIDHGKGKKAHQLCPIQGEPDMELHSCLLRCFTLRERDQVKDWRDRLAKLVYGDCIGCYKGFLHAKDRLLSIYLNSFPSEKLQGVRDYIDSWEQNIALNLLGEKGIGPDRGLVHLAPPTLYAVLSLAASDKALGLRDLVRSAMTPLQALPTLQELPAGLLVYAIDSDPNARAYAAKQMIHLKPTPVQSTGSWPFLHAIDKVAAHFRDANALADWSLLPMIIRVAPSSASALTPVVLAHVHDRDAHLPDVLKAYTTLLKLRGHAIWRRESMHTAMSSANVGPSNQRLNGNDQNGQHFDDDEYPTLILSGILDNPYFTHPLLQTKDAVLDARQRTLYFSWMASHLDSLRDHNDAQFTEALKRLANFLFERMQQGHVPPACRSVALREAIDLVLRHADEHNCRQVVDLYATTIAQMALGDTAPDSVIRAAAQELMLQAFQMDAKAIAAGMCSLSQLSRKYNNLFKAYNRAKRRRTEAQMPSDMPASPDAILTMAAEDQYPIADTCTQLWREAYAALGPQSGKEGVGVLLQSLGHISVYTLPSISTHLLPKSADYPERYAAYQDRVKTSVSSLNKAIRLMRDDLADALGEYGEHSTEDAVQALCISNTYSILLLNLCPETGMYKTAQNLLRQAFSDVETRADCFRILFQINTTSAVRGLQDHLQSFVDAANQLVEANELAKWMVRSLADVLSVLCGSTDGLLRAGTSWSLVEDQGKRQSVALRLPDIWRLMCESVAAIFDRTPSWSQLLPREEMVAWFRDVTMFATQLVEALPTFRQVVRSASGSNSRIIGDAHKGNGGSTHEEEERMIEQLAFPIERATTWFRMNDQEILNETLAFVIKALDEFTDDVELPEQSRESMLQFVNSQMAIEDHDKRLTLLTDAQLADLKLRIDPSLGSVIEISDSSSDETRTASSSSKTAGVVKEEVRTSSRPTSDNAHWWSGVGLFGSSLSSSQERKKKKKLKQQKLSFAPVDPSQVIDVDASDNETTTKSKAKAAPSISLDFTSSSKNSKAVPSKPPSAPINAYKGPTARSLAGVASAASASSSSRTAAAPKSTGKLAQLRQEMGPSRSWRPTNVNARPTSGVHRPERDDEPIRGPMATSSVTGALIGKAQPAATDSKSSGKPATGGDSSSSSSDDSDDSNDEEAEAKGLAALNRERAPLRPRVTVQSAPKRQLKVLEDPVITKARLQRQEAERKRKLRSPPDYSGLHRSILAWNYAHEGDFPPLHGKEPPYMRVPPTLKDAIEYGQVFGPLLLLECWAQLQQAREEADKSTETVPIEIGGRSTVDHFVDINATIPPAAISPQFYLNETEIVRLKERSSGPGTAAKVVLAKVEAFKRHPQGHQVTLRCCLIDDKQGASSALVNRSQWSITKLFSLTTLHREFAALMASPYYDLFPNVLKARVSPKPALTTQEVQQAMRAYAVNEPQARAVIGSLKTDGFSLIQGPPGTGKTKTICALVGAFVSRRRGPATSVMAGKTAGTVGPVKKILLCAPSNAAIDEVAKRAKAGMRNADGKTIYPKVVRIGREEGMNVSVKDISLDYLVEQRLDGGADSRARDEAPATDPSVLHAEIHNLKRQREEKQAELASARGNPALAAQLEAEIRNLSAKRLAVMSRLDDAKDKAQSASRKVEADRRGVRLDILAEADVICTTLSGAGHEMLNSLPFDFETVVVDEAAQAVELSTIIPLRYGCKQCILVGDPNQLPPTVISQQAEKLNYSQSLFVRMYDRSPEAVHLLSIQYRMHPEISIFPSTTFYGSKLSDGPNMAELTAQPWHDYELTRPFKFFNSRAPESQGRGHSLINREEANLALALYERMRQDYPYENFDYRIGVVTMYKAQVFELKRTFASRYGQDIVNRIDFNTVDGFQGQEKDIIILSCVRSSNDGRPIGFLSDRRRVNVAITRAKSNLFIIGNAEHLAQGDKLWSTLVQTAKDRNALQMVTVSTFAKSAKLVPAPKRPTSKPAAATAPNAPARTQAATTTSTAPRRTNLQQPPQRPPQPSSMQTGGNRESAAKPPVSSDKKRKGIVVREEPMEKKRRTDGGSLAAGNPTARSGPPNGSSGTTVKRMNAPMKRPAAPPTIKRSGRDAMGHISVGIPASGARPGPPTGPAAARSTGETRPSNGPVAKGPSKPSDAAMNALFVKKRK